MAYILHGLSLKANKFCIRCGVEVAPDARLCSECAILVMRKKLRRDRNVSLLQK